MFTAILTFDHTACVSYFLWLAIIIILARGRTLVGVTTSYHLPWGYKKPLEILAFILGAPEMSRETMLWSGLDRKNFLEDIWNEAQGFWEYHCESRMSGKNLLLFLAFQPFWMIHIVFGHFLEWRSSVRLMIVYCDRAEWCARFSHCTTHADHKMSLNDPNSQKLGFLVICWSFGVAYFDRIKVCTIWLSYHSWWIIQRQEKTLNESTLLKK